MSILIWKFSIEAFNHGDKQRIKLPMPYKFLGLGPDLKMNPCVWALVGDGRTVEVTVHCYWTRAPINDFPPALCDLQYLGTCATPSGFLMCHYFADFIGEDVQS